MIWVIAGTKSGREIVKELLDRNYKVIGTTATGYGNRLLGSHDNLITLSKPLKVRNMKRLVKSYKVKLIIDASHPYAERVSRNAIIVSRKRNVPYIRLERKNIQFPEAKIFDSYFDAAEYLGGRDGNVLLTIGSNSLSFFREIANDRIFVRILPYIDSFRRCEKNGFMPHQIVAIKGPF